jgi:predicted chitinase
MRANEFVTEAPRDVFHFVGKSPAVPRATGNYYKWQVNLSNGQHYYIRAGAYTKLEKFQQYFARKWGAEMPDVEVVDATRLERLSEGELDEMDRRGFLGALGAGAMAATGVPAQAKSKQPEPTAFLSAHIEAEEMLHKTALRAGMRGAELAQFLAQCYHESAGFGRMHEYATGKEYEGRRDLGNVNRGDGVRYKGRGFIQITGRDNYRRAGQALGLPLEEKPDLASRPDVAARIAVWYWVSRVKPNVANFNDTRAVTQQINPKLNGLADRHENFKDYKNMFSVTRTGT